MRVLELIGEVTGWLVVAAVWCGLSLFFFVTVLLLLFGEGELTINGMTRRWQGLIGRGIVEARVNKSHCDQCGEYVSRQEGTWVHTETGSPHCVQGIVNGKVVSWSGEECEPCGIEGCFSNEEWETEPK